MNKRIKHLALSLAYAFVLLTSATICITACASTIAKSADGETEQDGANQTETVEIMSEKMGRKIKATIVTPEQYSDPDLQEDQYPVLYLLHGAYGSYQDWPSKTHLDDMASDYGVIIVCPDGQDSWYFDSPIDPKMQFETFISKELVDYVDNNYRTIPTPGMRAITGLSMGGHGALFVAFRHPDVFQSCGSMSGGVNICHFPDKWHIKDRLGDYQSNKQVWESHSVAGLVSSLKPGQNITIDDGVDDIQRSARSPAQARHTPRLHRETRRAHLELLDKFARLSDSVFQQVLRQGRQNQVSVAFSAPRSGV